MRLILLAFLITTPASAQIAPVNTGSALNRGDTVVLMVRRSHSNPGVAAPDSAALYRALSAELLKAGVTVADRPTPRFGAVSVHLTTTDPASLPKNRLYAVSVERQLLGATKADPRPQYVGVWSRMMLGTVKRTESPLEQVRAFFTHTLGEM